MYIKIVVRKKDNVIVQKGDIIGQNIVDTRYIAFAEVNSQDDIILELTKYVDGQLVQPTEAEKTAYNATRQAEVNSVLEATKQSRYEMRVESLIRKKYSISQEFALLRQRETKSDEFDAYWQYAEQCKAQAKQEILGG